MHLTSFISAITLTLATLAIAHSFDIDNHQLYARDAELKYDDLALQRRSDYLAGFEAGLQARSDERGALLP